MRWSGQAIGAESASALPGLGTMRGLVRSVQTPEFAGITFHEVLAKSALNQVPGSSNALPFAWTINPYRGCSHACVFCFARQTHTYLDLFAALRWHNLGTFIGAGLKNLSLVGYLVTEVLSTRGKRFRALQQFAPTAESQDWYLITAGQRVQIMKRDADGKAVIQFGTEVVSGADGSIAGLLGASPGASTAVPIMLDVIAKCFPSKRDAWRSKLVEMVPSYGGTLSDDVATAEKTIARTAEALGIPA